MGKMTYEVDLVKESGFDEIRIKNKSFGAKLNILTGMQGDDFLFYCPALKISCFGKTKKESLDSLKFKLAAFCQKLVEMNLNEREKFLVSLGFQQHKFHTKSYYKPNGERKMRIRYFDEGTLKRNIYKITNSG